MANKTFSIRDHGASVDTRYTLSLQFSDPCDPFGAAVCKDLVNLTPDELNQLRDAIDRLAPAKGTGVENFLTELKRLAIKYDAHGKLVKDSNSGAYLKIDGKYADELIFGWNTNYATFSEKTTVKI